MAVNPSFIPSAIARQFDVSEKQQWISDAAYFKAEKRGFKPGYEVTDWLEAERDYAEMKVALFLSAAREDGMMTMAGLQQLAKHFGIQNLEDIVSESQLIQLIQAATHQEPCFRTKPGKSCENQDGCQWQAECQKLIADWYR